MTQKNLIADNDHFKWRNSEVYLRQWIVAELPVEMNA